MDITKEAEELNPWYQTIIEDGKVIIRGHGGCGDHAWPYIRELIPYTLAGKSILDLGSNAGIHCIRAALEGANVLGIEAVDLYCEQFAFLLAFFEEKYNKQLNIDIIKENVETLDFSKIGKFDIVFANAILYHLGKLTGKRGQKEEIRRLRDNVIVNSCNVSKDIIITRLLRNDGEASLDDLNFNLCGFKLCERNLKSRCLSLYRRNCIGWSTYDEVDPITDIKMAIGKDD